ncbi:MAG: PASTA domain-containing protein, partial [Gemmatimonadota bacterium]
GSDALAPRALLSYLGLGLAGGLLGYFLATLVFFPAPPPPADLEEVPGLMGLDMDEARARVESAGLALAQVDYLRHPQVDSGTVMGQSPLAGQLSVPGDSVRITVSLGPERRTVPPVRQLPGDRAVALLQATGFEVEADYVESDEPRGSILAISPEEGTEVPLPSDVRIRLSMGPPAVFVPDLLQLTEEEARDTLTGLGLEVEDVEEVFRFGRDQGRVVSQEPPAGTELERGASVRLVIGRRGGGARPRQ